MTKSTEPGTEAGPPGTVGLYRLLAWTSPAFPIGAFSYSHGLEAAADAGTVHDRATLRLWIAAIVLHGSGRVDADILRDAYRAAAAGDEQGLADANRRGLAYRATAELALESGQQGDAFLASWQSAWCDSHPAVAGAVSTLSESAGEGGRGRSPRAGEAVAIRIAAVAAACGRDGRGPFETGVPVCHPAIFGAAAAGAAIPLADALLAFLQAFASNLVSAGLRLGILGQTDGQRILAALESEIRQAAAAALARDAADFGSASFAADLASMHHETQYTRLFRS
jgi:urease accessory protein